MVRFKIAEVEIFFPYDYVYPEQYEYMRQLKATLDAQGHCVLEMPTGTGKTVALLSLITAYQLTHPAVGKLIYCTRTVPEMEKALKELKVVIEYRMEQLKEDQINAQRHAGASPTPVAPNLGNILAVGMSARRNLCIHPEISQEVDREKIDERCRRLTAPWVRQQVLNPDAIKTHGHWQGEAEPEFLEPPTSAPPDDNNNDNNKTTSNDDTHMEDQDASSNPPVEGRETKQEEGTDGQGPSESDMSGPMRVETEQLEEEGGNVTVPMDIEDLGGAHPASRSAAEDETEDAPGGASACSSSRLCPYYENFEAYWGLPILPSGVYTIDELRTAAREAIHPARKTAIPMCPYFTARRLLQVCVPLCMYVRNSSLCVCAHSCV